MGNRLFYLDEMDAVRNNNKGAIMYIIYNLSI